MQLKVESEHPNLLLEAALLGGYFSSISIANWFGQFVSLLCEISAFVGYKYESHPQRRTVVSVFNT